ncbi:hypothetical protein QAD02_003080 [Eretmocerus hayati]|uniref:Uncharacterized protein n=1 Tax=Eretmocerus hayati TaxID=131215 RepID=A0ACC2NLN0_9HYME|nr:hypothetical protein QAD02_003080 [Eretmocerus hayati]
MDGETTGEELMAAAKDIPHFRGVFLRTQLPYLRGPAWREKAIINLCDESSPGTHWCCYTKNGSRVRFYNSYGNLRPPSELVQYLGPQCEISYNRSQHQTYSQKNCGHLCIKFLKESAIKGE